MKALHWDNYDTMQVDEVNISFNIHNGKSIFEEYMKPIAMSVEEFLRYENPWDEHTIVEEDKHFAIITSKNHIDMFAWGPNMHAIMNSMLTVRGFPQMVTNTTDQSIQKV